MNEIRQKDIKTKKPLPLTNLAIKKQSELLSIFAYVGLDTIKEETPIGLS